MSKFVKSVGVTALVAALTVLALGALAYIRPAAAADTPTTAALGGGRGFGRFDFSFSDLHDSTGQGLSEGAWHSRAIGWSCAGGMNR